MSVIEIRLMFFYKVRMIDVHFPYYKACYRSSKINPIKKLKLEQAMIKHFGLRRICLTFDFYVFTA